MEARFDDLRDIYLSRLSNVSAIDKSKEIVFEPIAGPKDINS